MPKGKSFVETVREMVESGHSLPAVIETLTALGLSRGDAERLVGIMEKKALPRMRGEISRLVKKKVVSREEAEEIRLSKHRLSQVRRKAREWRSAGEKAGAVVREFFPEKAAGFKSRWQGLQKAREKEREGRKELQAFLLELDRENLPPRAEKKLDSAIGFLG